VQRREFLVRAGEFMLSGAVITVYVACGGDNGGGGSDGNTSPTAIHVTIANNHGHTLKLDQKDLTASTAMTLTLTLGSGHTHSLDLSGTDVDDLIAGTEVSRMSSNNSGHTHQVTLTP
jgi:hypothetical protein